MSEVSSRPRVRSVVCRSLDIHANGSVVVGAVVSEALRGLASEAFATQPSIECPRVDRLIASPEAALQLAEMRVDAAARVVPGADRLVAEKAAALLAVSQTPLVVRPAAVTSQVARLMEAPTVEAVRQAERDLLRTAKAEHSQVVSKALAVSCHQASIEAGFANVETRVGTRGDIRVIATDASGRALVSEIHRGDDTHAPSIETEVVGFTDGRCHATLDRFDASMETQGVRTEGSPERKWTGGVCELSMAREFIRQKVGPTVRRPESSGTTRTRPVRRAGAVKQGGR
jgi:hypothetical protein